jgi:hypothetical protein
MQLNTRLERNDLDTIKHNLEEQLGDGGAHLVFRTFKLVYGMSEEDVMRKPAVLTEKLERLFGSSTAEAVMRNVRTMRR